jgi:hypothetical protein
MEQDGRVEVFFVNEKKQGNKETMFAREKGRKSTGSHEGKVG